MDNSQYISYEKKVAWALEEKYLTQERLNIYTLLEDVEVNWFWYEKDMLLFDNLWTEGYALWDIAERLGAEYHEALLMMVDRVMKKKIKKRKGGLNGTVSRGLTGREVERNGDDYNTAEPNGLDQLPNGEGRKGFL